MKSALFRIRSLPGISRRLRANYASAIFLALHGLLWPAAAATAPAPAAKGAKEGSEAIALAHLKSLTRVTTGMEPTVHLRSRC
jgi:hypothetical protein